MIYEDWWVCVGRDVLGGRVVVAVAVAVAVAVVVQLLMHMWRLLSFDETLLTWPLRNVLFYWHTTSSQMPWHQCNIMPRAWSHVVCLSYPKVIFRLVFYGQCRICFGNGIWKFASELCYYKNIVEGLPRFRSAAYFANRDEQLVKPYWV